MQYNNSKIILNIRKLLIKGIKEIKHPQNDYLIMKKIIPQSKKLKIDRKISHNLYKVKKNNNKLVTVKRKHKVKHKHKLLNYIMNYLINGAQNK